MDKTLSAKPHPQLALAIACCSTSSPRIACSNNKDLRKLFKNPCCQAEWNKNVLFGFS